MIKDFDSWNEKKKEIDNKNNNKFYHPRDIWWCKIGVNIGYEQDGKDEEFQRPVLILRGLSKNTCIIVPLTTSESKNKYRIPVGLIDDKKAHAIISQIKVIDTKRFVEKIGVLEKDIFNQILKSIKSLFDGF